MKMSGDKCHGRSEYDVKMMVKPPKEIMIILSSQSKSSGPKYPYLLQIPSFRLGHGHPLFPRT